MSACVVFNRRRRGSAAAASSTPDLSAAQVSPASGSMSGGEYIVVTDAVGIDLGATLTVGGVATPMLRISDTSFAFVPRAVAVGAVGAKNLVVTNPNTQSATKTSGYTYKAQSALAFTSMTALLAAKADYPTGTMFRAVDSSSNHIMHLILEADSTLAIQGFVDWTKVHTFLDAASHQFADVTGTANLVVDANGVTFDVATGGGVYLKGFTFGVNQKSINCRADLLAGNATPATNDSFCAGWITDPTVAYTVQAGGAYYNGSNWRQSRFSASSASSPTVTQASSNMAATIGTSFEPWLLWSMVRMCEDGTEAITSGGNEVSSGYYPVNDGSVSHVTAVGTSVVSGKPWFLFFGARSASTGTAQMRLISSVISPGVVL